MAVIDFEEVDGGEIGAARSRSSKCARDFNPARRSELGGGGGGSGAGVRCGGGGAAGVRCAGAGGSGGSGVLSRGINAEGSSGIGVVSRFTRTPCIVGSSLGS